MGVGWGCPSGGPSTVGCLTRGPSSSCPGRPGLLIPFHREGNRGPAAGGAAPTGGAGDPATCRPQSAPWKEVLEPSVKLLSNTRNNQHLGEGWHRLWGQRSEA